MIGRSRSTRTRTAVEAASPIAPGATAPRKDPSAMPSPVTAHGAEIPDHPAVIDDRPDGRVSVWTFSELNRETNRLANALLALGVRPGDRVAWCGQNSPGVVRAVHALAK